MIMHKRGSDMKPLKRFMWILAMSAFCLLSVHGQPPLSSSEKKIFSEFEKHAKEYVELRNRAAGKMAKISKDSTPEEIAAHKMALRTAVQSARAGATQGDLFTPDATQLIRAKIKAEFKGYERKELRKTVLEADTKGVPLRVNFPYPESKELVEMSPELLLSLPQLPKELRYRYIGWSLVVLDRDNALIIDFMKEALP